YHVRPHWGSTALPPPQRSPPSGALVQLRAEVLSWSRVSTLGASTSAVRLPSDLRNSHRSASSGSVLRPCSSSISVSSMAPLNASAFFWPSVFRLFWNCLPRSGSGHGRPWTAGLGTRTPCVSIRRLLQYPDQGSNLGRLFRRQV